MYTGNTRCSNYFHVRWARTIVSLCIRFSVLLASQKRAVILFCKCSISTPVFKESHYLVHVVSSGTSLLVALAPGEYSSKAESQKSTDVTPWQFPFKIILTNSQQPITSGLWDQLSSVTYYPTTLLSSPSLIYLLMICICIQIPHFIMEQVTAVVIWLI